MDNEGEKVVLFICSTPFHLYSVISLAKRKFENKNIDLIILDHSPGNHDMYLKLKEEKLFDNVFFLKTKELTGGSSENNLTRHIKSLKYFLNHSELTSQLLYKKKYSCIFIASPDIPSQIIYYHYKKLNKFLDLYMYGDGTFAYSYFDYKIGFLKRVFLRIMFNSNIMNEHKGGYVFGSEYMENYPGVEIIKITPISKHDEEMKEVLNRIMEYKESNLENINSKFIYFDQAFQFEKIIEQGKDLLKSIIQSVGKENIVVKLHPRTNKSTYNDTCNTLDTKVPFEMLILNKDITGKVLISINSTVCFNPKILFDEEPVVILLYKLVEFHNSMNSTNEISRLSEKVRSRYSQPERFFIPETKEELMKILNTIETYL